MKLSGTHRIVLAMALPSAFLVLWPGGWGPLWSYAASLPLIVLCAGWIARLKSSPLAWSAAALCCAIPAAGYGMSKQLISLFDTQYLDLQRGAEHCLAIMSVAADGVGPLLIAGGIAGMLLRAGSVGGLLALSGSLSVFAHWLVYAALEKLRSGAYTEAANSILIVEELRFLPLLAALLLMRDSEQLEKWLLAVAAIIGMWLVAPPVGLQLLRLEQGLAHPEGPVGTLGQGIAMPAADPASGDFAAQLDAQGTQQVPGKWWCNARPSPSWSTEIRAMAGLAMAKDTQLATLQPHLPELYQRWIQGVALVGSAGESAPPPLGLHMENPAVRFNLDPPPSTASWAEVGGEGPRWIGADGQDGACAWWVPWERTFGELFAAGQAWADDARCSQGIFILFGPAGEAPRQWRPALPCG